MDKRKSNYELTRDRVEGDFVKYDQRLRPVSERPGAAVEEIAAQIGGFRNPVQIVHPNKLPAEEGDFVKYDQHGMIEKFRLEHDEAYIFLRFLSCAYRVDRKTGRVERMDADGPVHAGFNDRWFHSA